MADSRSNTVQDLSGQRGSAQSTSSSRRLQPQRSQRSTTGLQRYGQESLANPFYLFRRMSDEMEQFFDRAFGGGYVPSRDAVSPGASLGAWTGANWAPRIEAFQRGDQFIVRAELPGLKREDIRVNVTDDSLIIEGERRDEFENTHGDVYHTERSYGSFYREVALPDGTLTDNAEASFKDGVLEVKLQAPPNEVRRGRAIDVK